MRCVVLLLLAVTDVFCRSEPSASLAGPANLDTLVYLQVVWRHGDRSPTSSFDPTEEKRWPDGFGELTKEGARQQYRLGKWMRDRYGSFLGDHFDRSQVYVRSSDYNRTLMSALVNMAGLYYPKTDEMWDEKIDWQPVPVHTIPKEIDKALVEDISCPEAVKEEERLYNSEPILAIEKNNSDFLKFLATRTGMQDLRFQNIWTVFDPLLCQSFHNQTNPWPSWVNASVFDRIEKLSHLSSSFKFHTELLRRLRGGVLLKEVYERFAAKVDGSVGDKSKMYAYSAHDTTLAALLSTFGIYPSIFPLYATMVILEMHSSNGAHYLKLYHKNITDSNNLFEYEIPGCNGQCTLNELKTDLEKYFPNDWDNECGRLNTNGVGWILIALISFISASVAIAIYSIGSFYYKKARKFRIRRQGEVPLISDDTEIS